MCRSIDFGFHLFHGHAAMIATLILIYIFLNVEPGDWQRGHYSATIWAEAFETMGNCIRARDQRAELPLSYGECEWVRT